jgi:hypothetical protein
MLRVTEVGSYDPPTPYATTVTAGASPSRFALRANFRSSNVATLAQALWLAWCSASAKSTPASQFARRNRPPGHPPRALPLNDATHSVQIGLSV